MNLKIAQSPHISMMNYKSSTSLYDKNCIFSRKTFLRQHLQSTEYFCREFLFILQQLLVFLSPSRSQVSDVLFYMLRQVTIVLQMGWLEKRW